MRMKIKNQILIISILLTTAFYAQKVDSNNVVNELDKIYSNLEYNTITYNDLKQQWIITDPEIVRDLVNRFIATNNVRLNENKVDRKFLNFLSEQVSLGNVSVILRKRYFDNEIEYFAFIKFNNGSFEDIPLIFDAVLDGFYLETIIGKYKYNQLKEREYFFNDLTKKDFETRFGYNFDINLNLINSELMFWNTTSKGRNKYLVSLFGDWGNDAIHYPGWTMQQLFVGGKLTYYNNLPPTPRYYSYALKFGTGLPTNTPYVTAVPKTPFLQSGNSAYGGLSVAFLHNKIYVDLDGMMTFTDYSLSDYDYDFGQNPVDFFSLRNFFSLTVRALDLYNLSDFGDLNVSLGVATHDINKYQYNPGQGIVDKEPKKEFFDRFNHFVNASVGITKEGGLIQHNIEFFVGYSPDSYGYFGIKLQVMLSNTFGLDVRMHNSFGLDTDKYPWRMDSYLVFSPIIRINY